MSASSRRAREPDALVLKLRDFASRVRLARALIGESGGFEDGSRGLKAEGQYPRFANQINHIASRRDARSSADAALRPLPGSMGFFEQSPAVSALRTSTAGYRLASFQDPCTSKYAHLQNKRFGLVWHSKSKSETSRRRLPKSQRDACAYVY